MAITTVKDVFEKMPQVFNAGEAAGLDLIFQFHITGAQGGDWNVVVKDSACKVSTGVHASPSVTFTMEDANWVAMWNGELDGMKAYMTGKLQLSGDIMSAQRLQSLFPF
ncbi:MAG: SCP2 sterol-binding domain-containing protein [Syntrophobacteraceae bacterium]